MWLSKRAQTLLNYLQDLAHAQGLGSAEGQGLQDAAAEGSTRLITLLSGAAVEPCHVSTHLAVVRAWSLIKLRMCLIVG